jgi:hypothetical protein
MTDGDDKDPKPERPSITRRDRLAALLIVLLVAGWLWLLWLIQ